MLRMRKISKRYYLRQVMACWLMCYMALGIPAQLAMAEVVLVAPTPGITVDPLVGNHQDMTATHGAIGNFSSFDIATGHTVDCAMDASAQALFKVSGPGTEILGNFNADGGIWLINPAGILIGDNAVINVSNLVASSLNIEDADFTSGLTSGVFQFTGGATAGDVTNEGSITAERIALIAKNVINRGHILAAECAIMAAGDRVLISENSPVAVEVSMGADWAPGDYSVYQVKNVDGDGIEVGQGGEMETAQVVLAAGDIWSAALVTASAGGLEAVATIDIDAAGDVIVTNKVIAEAVGKGGENVAAIAIDAGGDVQVIAKAEVGDESARQALIQAKTQYGATNTSEILICADGYLTVESEGGWEDTDHDIWYGSTASIEAIAQSIDSMAQKNTADVRIGAGEGINVTAISDFYTVDSSYSTEASASIAAKAIGGGVENTAGVVACTEGGVQVTAERGGDAAILAQAFYGHTTDAYVGICAVDDVIVAAGIGSGGGTAMIKAEAAQYLENGVSLATANGNGNYEPPSANAEVVVVSHEGDVAVVDVGEVGDTAKIVAEAYNAYSNTASVGVAAENVTVQALGEGSMAYILAYAHNGFENTADTVVCAPGEVTVTNADGSIAKIAAVAVYGELNNTATTQVYASEVTVSDEGIAFIGSIAGGDLVYVPESDKDGFCLTDDDKVAWTEGGATLIIGDYGDRQDCPDCPPCPCEEDDEDFFAPVAPLAQFEIPRIEGCPALTQAAAIELGITGETLQVAIGNALALNPTIQPCEACATLVNAASILRDEDGSRMAAMAQVFNTLAPADAPFTPEMATSIAMAFGGAAEGSQYASVMEYIDAFVQYAAVLDTELGSPVGDSVAFVMGKYGEDITGSDNGNIAAFVATRLEAIGM